MALGEFPNVPLEDRVYVGVDGEGGFTYVRHRGGVEIQVTDADLAAIADQWCFFYSDAALTQLHGMFADPTKETAWIQR